MIAYLKKINYKLCSPEGCQEETLSSTARLCQSEMIWRLQAREHHKKYTMYILSGALGVVNWIKRKGHPELEVLRILREFGCFVHV